MGTFNQSLQCTQDVFVGFQAPSPPVSARPLTLLDRSLCLTIHSTWPPTLLDRPLCSTIPSAQPPALRGFNLPMKNWTMKEEYEWLTERFPRWYKRQERQERGFIKKTTAEFLVMFPDRKAIHLKLESVSIPSLLSPAQLLTQV